MKETKNKEEKYISVERNNIKRQKDRQKERGEEERYAQEGRQKTSNTFSRCLSQQ